MADTIYYLNPNDAGYLLYQYAESALRALTQTLAYNIIVDKNTPEYEYALKILDIAQTEGLLVATQKLRHKRSLKDAAFIRWIGKEIEKCLDKEDVFFHGVIDEFYLYHNNNIGYLYSVMGICLMAGLNRHYLEIWT